MSGRCVQPNIFHQPFFGWIFAAQQVTDRTIAIYASDISSVCHNFPNDAEVRQNIRRAACPSSEILRQEAA